MNKHSGNFIGPRYCDICAEWPARETDRGNRCHWCETMEWCEEHPVPLPNNVKFIRTLADYGYKPALEKMEELKSK